LLCSKKQGTQLLEQVFGAESRISILKKNMGQIEPLFSKNKENADARSVQQSWVEDMMITSE
jgi:hypothetical protein